MPEVLFLQFDWFEHLGILYLSAYLKERGIKTALLITRSPKKLVKKVNQLQPRLLAISLLSAGYKKPLEILEKAKAQLNCPVVVGGSHPTFFPEVLSHPALDFIIRGEGEESLYLLVQALKGEISLKEVPGLGYKSEGELKYNPLGNLVEELDSLPFPNRKLYFGYGYYRRLGMRRVITARGCPYSCRYCYNARLRSFYPGQKYFRQRSAENVIRELKEMRSYTRVVNFVDDSFGINPEFRREFLERYAQEVKLPFIVNLRPELVDKEFAGLLARAGCYCAQLGIESGDEALRQKLLGRKTRDEQIISAVHYLKELGIKILAYNMLALPGESLEQGLKTIQLNQKLGVDFPRFSIFQPYPGTELAEELVREGKASQNQLLKALEGSYFHSSPLESREIKNLENLQKFSSLLIKFPGLEPAVKKLVLLRSNPVFDLVFLLSMAFQYKQATARSLRETLELGIRNLSLYFQ